MRIGIDIRYLSHGLVGGVHTYVTHLVPALLDAAPHDQFVLYADRKQPLELTDLPANATVRYLPWRHAVSSVWNDWAGLARQMAADRLDIAHFPTNYGFGPRNACTVLTVHDAMTLMPLSHVFQSKGTRWSPRTTAMTVYLFACSHLALRGATMVLTVSEHARGEIARYGRFPAERIVAAHHAPTPDLRRVTDGNALAAARVRYGLTRPFVLADGLKNPDALLRAWRRLPTGLREGFEIVFFARREPLPLAREAEAAGQCRVLLNIPRADLIALYSQATCFAFPSWLEGFGIPILEAMTCGAPVICADNSAMPEVAGGAALLCGAEDDAALAAHLERVLARPSEAERLRSLGFARAAAFSWRATAERTLETYRHAAGARLTDGRPLSRKPSM